jgi:hypothetical protein
LRRPGKGLQSSTWIQLPACMPAARVRVAICSHAGCQHRCMEMAKLPRAGQTGPGLRHS